MLPRRPDDIGEWLADGRAFESAGADLLGVDLDEETDLDALALVAALAAVTFRSLLVTRVPDTGTVARTVGTIERMSRGRFRFLVDGTSPDEFDLREVAGTADGAAEAAEPELWLRVPSPEGRAAWRATVDAAAELGHARLMVTASPRLLDILRNPEEPDERLDLQLAQGLTPAHSQQTDASGCGPRAQDQTRSNLRLREGGRHGGHPASVPPARRGGAGALGVSPLGFDLAPATQVKQDLRIEGATVSHSVCPYCAVGCALLAYTKKAPTARRRAAADRGRPGQPGQRGPPVPEGRQRAAAGRVPPPGRRARCTASPGATEWKQVSWDFALDKLAQQHQGLARPHVRRPPTATATWSTGARASPSPAAPRSAREEGYFATKVMRGLGVVYLEQQARV